MSSSGESGGDEKHSSSLCKSASNVSEADVSAPGSEQCHTKSHVMNQLQVS